MSLQRALKRYPAPFIMKAGIQRAFGLLTSRLRLAPDFIIIGGQRCGTTSLFNYLSRHPDIYPSFPKETQYFSNHFHRGMLWYRSHFPLAVRRQYARGVRKRPFAAGEATPYYLAHPFAARRIRARLPQARLIVLLRNPVERAHSHYRYEVKLGIEPLSFAEAVDREAERLCGEVEKMAADERYLSFNHQHFSYLARGIYADQLARWFAFFPRDQFLILKSEDFYHAPGEALKKTTQFLDLPEFHLSRFEKFNATQSGQMEPGMRNRLEEYYRPHNERLSALLGAEFLWNGS